MDPTTRRIDAPAAQKTTVALTDPKGKAAPGIGVPESRSRKRIIIVSVLGVLFGTVAFVMLNSRAPAAPVSRPVPEAAVPARAPISPAAARVASLKEPAAPKWTGGVQNAWSKQPTAAYELLAENQIALWTKRVRPVLTVRCVSGRTEVFVLTESSAAMEGDDGKHTVRVGFDAGGDTTQRWLASADYDALFSPDAVRLAQQIATSQTMRFGFTPYNASPVVVQFEVGGFDAVIGTIAKTCRWQ